MTSQLLLRLVVVLPLCLGTLVDVPAEPGALNRAVHNVGTAAASGQQRLRLAPGVHQLLQPLLLTAAHSGLQFEGSTDGASVISGGIEIHPSAWTEYAAAACPGCGSVMRAPLPVGTKYSRQLYVNNIRANWTMALFPQDGAALTPTGYSVPAASGLNWTHNSGSAVEMVYRGTHSSGAQWTESRTPVSNFVAGDGLVDGHSHITMAAAGFAAGRNKAYNQLLGLPEYYQNVFELLGDAHKGKKGDFYLDLDKSSGAGFIYLVTSEADATEPIRAVLPQLELLVDARPGTKDVSWTDVTFAEATWLLPSTEVGFVEMQAGCTLRGAAPPSGHKDWYDDSTWSPTTANILMVGVTGARFERCTFTRLGACGVSFEGGSQNNSITHSVFTDISASAVSIGRTDTYNITDPSKQDANNAVTDSRISFVAAEFHGAPGVAVFYARGCQLVHNELFELPYSGYSIGWGWGRTMEILWPQMPWDSNNSISGNDIHDVMQMLGDGGSIYTLGPQGNVPYPKGPSGKVYPTVPEPPLKVLPPSTMIGNYIHGTGPRDDMVEAPGFGSHFPGGLYNDEGTTNWHMMGNVIVDAGAWLQGCRFADGWIGHMEQSNNFISCDKKSPYSKNDCSLINANTSQADCNVMNDVHYASPDDLPATAQAIMSAAGPRKAFG